MEEEKDLFGEVVVKDLLLRDKFIEPPFSVLDTKSGNWQNRKRLWLSKGIKSEVGRDATTFNMAKWNKEKNGNDLPSDTSIFDPALCEVIYHWFCPEGGYILDPFAGGSVRGIVAGYLGYNYTGIDIRKEQIESNISQALVILPPEKQPKYFTGDSSVVLRGWMEGKTLTELTPIEECTTPTGKIRVKREDLYNAYGSCGAKSRTALFLIKKAIAEGFTKVTTAGSRKSPQINIVATIGRALGLEVIAHCPEGELGEELIEAEKLGAEIIRHNPGYNSVIKARCAEYAKAHNAYEIPFGMMCNEAIEQTSQQVNISQDILSDIKRIVIVVGSGMNLCGLLWGLKTQKEKSGRDVPVLGIIVGADPIPTLNMFAPKDWESMVTLQKSSLDYHQEATTTQWNGIKLDPIYEAKCVEYLQDGDLFWIVGLRNSLNKNAPKQAFNREVHTIKKHTEYDLVFSCPPYADLEVYSNLKGDISNMPYKKFLPAYEDIISKSCKLLKKGGYACFVVGEVRDKDGYYIGFVPDTIRAFEKAGMRLYNEAILLNTMASAGMRAGGNMKSQKLVKVHQNVLVFKKP